MESAPHNSWSIWISYSFDIIYNPYWEYNLYKYYLYILCVTQKNMKCIQVMESAPHSSWANNGLYSIHIIYNPYRE